MKFEFDIGDGFHFQSTMTIIVELEEDFDTIAKDFTTNETGFSEPKHSNIRLDVKNRTIIIGIEDYVKKDNICTCCNCDGSCQE